MYPNASDVVTYRFIDGRTVNVFRSDNLTYWNKQSLNKYVSFFAGVARLYNQRQIRRWNFEQVALHNGARDCGFPYYATA